MRTTTAIHSLGNRPTIFDNKYELNSVVGRGRGSVVYKAYRLPENSEVTESESDPVALKVLTGTERKPEEALVRIKKEARALVSLNHPNIIRAYNYVARPDCCYLSLEYADHGDLAKVVEQSKNKISIKSAIRITRSILKGLAHIHRHNIIHRDLKLENILVAKDLTIKITDFSIALLDGEKSDLNLVNKFVGTLDYVAPECLRGQPYTNCSDLYSVGIIFYKLITNNFPFEGQSIHESIELKTRGEFNKLSRSILDEAPSIEAFLKKILSPDPSLRFSSARKAEEELLKIASALELQLSKKNDGYLKPNEISTKATMALGKRIKRFFVGSLIVISGLTMVTLGAKRLNLDDFSYLKKSDGQIAVYNQDLEMSLFADLMEKSGVGVFESLYNSNKHYRFSILPYGKDQALFTLGIKSGETIVIDLKPLKEGGALTIEGKGVNIILRPDSKDGNNYEGEFQNLLHGTKGIWKLSFI